MDAITQDRPMALVKNAWKSYRGSYFALKDLSLRIPKGKIYSILGASGVGKTTLLKCISGSMCLDAGQVSVDITSKLQIGYMPQELGLYMELSVLETFYVFGMIMHLSRKEIVRQMNKLVSLLELPDKNLQICNLSGGQQRRISIAVAVLKNPDLLILDEPTVSLDSILKKSIWNYLERISKHEGKTIVLTTHYIEEAKSSDLVAFMNNGTILQEGTPSEVTASANCHSLEEVYYKLCHQQILNKIEPEFPKALQPTNGLSTNNSQYSNKRMLALGLKSFYYLRRNFGVFYVFIFTPAILTVIMSHSVKRPSQLPIGYVNLESDCLFVEDMNCTTPLSCRFLTGLNRNDINMIRFKSVAEAREAVMKNRIWGLVRFNSNFSEAVVNRLDYFYSLESVDVSDEDEARVWLDMSSFPIGNMLKRTFYDSYLESIQDWYGDCGWKKKAAHPLLRVVQPFYGSFDDSILTSCNPGITIMLVFSGACSLALILILTEKEFGTFERCRVVGMTLWELLGSEFLFCFLIMIPAGATQLLILYLYSGPSNAPVYLAIVLVYLVAVTGILFGLLVALLTNNLSVALLVSVTLMNSFYYLSGVLWPIEGAHWFARFLNNVLPSIIPVHSMVDMANKGSTITDSEVYKGFLNSFLWIAILLFFIVFLVKRNNKQ